MSKIYKYTHTQQIIINEDVDFFANIFFEKVKKRLQKSYILENEQTARELNFKGSIFRFAWNAWDLFNPISKGKIQFMIVDEVKFLKFQINFIEALVIALCFTIIPIFSFAFESEISAMIFAGIWFLYFLNYVISTVRFKKFINKTINEVKDASSYVEEDAQEARLRNIEFIMKNEIPWLDYKRKG